MNQLMILTIISRKKHMISQTKMDNIDKDPMTYINELILNNIFTFRKVTYIEKHHFQFQTKQSCDIMGFNIKLLRTITNLTTIPFTNPIN